MIFHLAAYAFGLVLHKSEEKLARVVIDVTTWLVAMNIESAWRDDFAETIPGPYPLSMV